MNANRIAELFGLDGKVALVTGAAAGIGLDIATLLAQAGAQVVLADRNGESAAQSAESLKKAGLTATAVACDVRSEESVCALFATIKSRFGKADILVNNAGIYPKKLLPDITLDEWNEVHEINLRGTFLCMREAVRLLRETDSPGSIVNISSVASLHPATHGNIHYSASKAGVNQLTKSTALDFAAHRIRVNAVLPGATEAIHPGRATQFAIPVTGPVTMPGRWLLPDVQTGVDIAAAVLYFASPASQAVTGQLLAVDRGFLLS
jgi:NAD(P)-dependent dehydrogenase (short-subunit alcohol dehydrogenase family)